MSNWENLLLCPNHLHGLLMLKSTVGVQDIEPLQKHSFQHIIPKSVGSIVRGFKIGVTNWSRQNTDLHDGWQRNYLSREILHSN
jgi:REP element-mobilizing transposase RayT